MKYEVKEVVTPQNYNLCLQNEIDNAPKQYRDLKTKYPDAILLFRLGGFYEAYCDDAETCANILHVTMTTNNKRSYRMAGFPFHALDTYLPKLIRAGKRVAICDRIEEQNKTL